MQFDKRYNGCACLGPCWRKPPPEVRRSKTPVTGSGALLRRYPPGVSFFCAADRSLTCLGPMLATALPQDPKIECPGTGSDAPQRRYPPGGCSSRDSDLSQTAPDSSATRSAHKPLCTLAGAVL